MRRSGQCFILSIFQCIVLAAVFCPFCAEVAAAQYYFDKWTTDEGLPQNTVGAIQQTRDGYLWLATLDGLVRFDGVRFTAFTTGNSRGILNNRFRRLHEAADGSLWAGTEEFGATRYRNGEFRTFTEADGLFDNLVLGFADDVDGALLVLSNKGVVRFDGERFEPTGIAYSINGATCAARGGGLWHLDRNGLRLWQKGTVTRVELSEFNLKIDYPPLCYEDSSGAVWLASNYKELFVVRNKSAVKYRLDEPRLAEATITFIAEDKQKNLWFGTSKGLLRLQNEQFELFDDNAGLSDVNLLSFWEDREGTIWLGTALGGLNHLTPKAISVLTAREGLAGNSVYPIYEAPDGSIWVGANGLTRIQKGVFQAYTFQKNGVPSDVTAIAETSDGRLWLGTSGNIGFWQNEKFTDFGENFVFPVGSYTIWAIHQDRAGNLWFGTSKGLVRKNGDEFRAYTVADGLPSNDIKAILETGEGGLWLATYGGLSRFENGKFQNTTQAQGLSSNLVRSLFMDENGALWAGTYDGGLNRLSDGRITNYSTRNGLFSDGVFQILPDEAGFFWMSSNQGIYRVRRQELEDLAAGTIQFVTSEAFGKRDGLLNTECNGGRQPAGIRARDGRLWFPTQHGAAIVDPAAIRKNPQPPPVVIEQITIDGKNFASGAEVSLAPNQTNLEIAYTGLSFVKPEQVRFRYRLEGLDENWIEAGTRRTAYYAHLPPGEYTFHVAAANNSGVWNQAGASLRLTVQPPFWKTPWFAALAILSLGALIYFLIHRRVSLLERERAAQIAFAQKLISAQESERKRIAGELHDGLGQNLLVIKNWSLLAQQKRENAEIIEEISGTASATIEEVRRIAYNLRPYQIDEIGLTRAVEGMLKRLATTTEIRLKWQIDNIDGVFATENEINFFRIVQESLNNVIKHSGATEASLEIERGENHILLRIEDNGRGFAPESLNGKRGLGLTGIEERARMIGGAALIQSAEGKGTVISIKINL